MTVISVRDRTNVSADRDLPAFDAFFESEYARIVRAVAVVVRDVAEAEDLVQEAMVRAYLRWTRISRMVSPAGYVYRTAVNLHRTRMRRLRTFLRLTRSMPDQIVAPAAEQAIARTDVEHALRRLPTDHRDALILTVWFGMTSEEAGRLLGIAAGSVRSRVARARAALAQDLKDELPGGDDAQSQG